MRNLRKKRTENREKWRNTARCSGFPNFGGGIKLGRGLGIWTWDRVQESYGRRFTDARTEPEFVNEIGKRARIPARAFGSGLVSIARTELKAGKGTSRNEIPCR